MPKILCSGQAAFSDFDTVDLCRFQFYEALNLNLRAGSISTTVLKTLKCFQITYYWTFWAISYNIPTNCDLEKISTQKITFLAFFGIFQKIAKKFFCISRHFRPFWKIGKNFPKIYGLEFRHIWPFSSFHTQNSSVFRISEPYNVLCRIYRITNTFLVKRRPFFVFKFRLSLYF